MALQRTNDPADLQRLRPDLERLADIDPSSEGPAPRWEELRDAMSSLKLVVDGLVDFVQVSFFMLLMRFFRKAYLYNVFLKQKIVLLTISYLFNGSLPFYANLYIYECFTVICVRNGMPA